MTPNRQTNSDHSTSPSPFGFSHIFFYILLSLGMGTGILAIHIFVTAPRERMILEGIFIGVAIILACSQLMIHYTLFSRLWSPLREFVKELRNHCNHLEAENGEEILKNLKASCGQMVHFSAQLKNRYPAEVQQLHSIFLRQMQLLETYAKESQAHSSLAVLGQVCAQVAHDIRNPLTALTTFLEFVPDDALDKRVVALKGAAHRSCARLLQMADELLDHKRAAHIEKKPIDLGTLIQWTCDELRGQATEKNVAIHYNGPSSLDYYGDADKLARVLQNILSNGVQAMETLDDGRLAVTLRQSATHITLDISDTGCGIPEEHLPKLFQPTFTTKGKNGTGLGLAYCQNVIHGHGGKIKVYNNCEQGATFRITLPHLTVN